jgi:hypothetical protein
VVIPSLYPGDSVNLPSGDIEKAFVTGYQDSNLKEVTDKFYDVYKLKDNCISYRKLDLATTDLAPWIDFFLTEFDNFVRNRVLGADSHYTRLIGKKFSLLVKLESGDSISKTLQFGDGLVAWDPRANKICYVGEAAFFCILKGEALFEDLYTGYNAEWERFPQNEFNRDMVVMITMFSYVYRNRLSSDANARFLSSSE